MLVFNPPLSSLIDVTASVLVVLGEIPGHVPRAERTNEPCNVLGFFRSHVILLKDLTISFNHQHKPRRLSAVLSVLCSSPRRLTHRAPLIG
jgi:hypothetical protein